MGIFTVLFEPRTVLRKWWYWVDIQYISRRLDKYSNMGDSPVIKFDRAIQEEGSMV